MSTYSELFRKQTAHRSTAPQEEDTTNTNVSNNDSKTGTPLSVIKKETLQPAGNIGEVDWHKGENERNYRKQHAGEEPESANEKAKRENKERINKLILGLGEGLNAIARLHYVAKDAPYVPNKEGKTATEKLIEKYALADKDKDAAKLAYYNGLNSAKNDDKEYDQKQAAINVATHHTAAKAAADAEKAEQAQKNWQAKFDAEQEKEKRNAEERERHNKANEDLARQRNNIAARNAATAYAKASGGSGSGKNVWTLKVHDASISDNTDDFKNYGEKTYKTKEDYERAVMKYAKQFGVPTEYEEDKGDIYGTKIKKKRSVSSIAADIEREAQRLAENYVIGEDEWNK